MFYHTKKSVKQRISYVSFVKYFNKHPLTIQQIAVIQQILPSAVYKILTANIDNSGPIWYHVMYLSAMLYLYCIKNIWTWTKWLACCRQHFERLHLYFGYNSILCIGTLDHFHPVSSIMQEIPWRDCALSFQRAFLCNNLNAWRPLLSQDNLDFTQTTRLGLLISIQNTIKNM